ncbi:MAG TPA: hypothetical protein VGK52_09635 [Polyangia bacterium]|jgi:hypothetical protein
MSFTPSAQTRRTVGTTFRWLVLLPVLMVGSLLYWSVAIGLGGMSLMAASALSISTDSTLGVAPASETGAPATLEGGDGTTPIVVHLEESVEPEDVNDNAGAAGFAQPADDTQVTVTPGPGATSF